VSGPDQLSPQARLALREAVNDQLRRYLTFLGVSNLAALVAVVGSIYASLDSRLDVRLTEYIEKHHAIQQLRETAYSDALREVREAGKLAGQLSERVEHLDALTESARGIGDADLRQLESLVAVLADKDKLELNALIDSRVDARLGAQSTAATPTDVACQVTKVQFVTSGEKMSKWVGCEPGWYLQDIRGRAVDGQLGLQGNCCRQQ
jgi:hypothetical protein